MVDNCQQLPQEAAEMVGTELVGSPAPAGSKAASVDLATAQEATATFPASVPTVQWQTQCKVSWKSLQRPYILQMGKQKPTEVLGTQSSSLSKL